MYRRSAIACLLLASALSAAEGPPVVRVDTVPIRFKVPDLSKVETATLWATNDGGVSWKQVEELTIDPEAEQPPTFRYEVPMDGEYGFHTRAIYRDGSSDPKPTPGQGPKRGNVVVVDRGAPLVEDFSVITDPEDPLLVRITWRVGDANPGPKPVRFAMAPREGGEWIPFGPRQVPAGSWTVAFPVATHQLRLEARDRAGNRSASEAWAPPLPDPAPASDGGDDPPETPPEEAGGDGSDGEPDTRGEEPPEEPTPEELETAIAELPDPVDLEESVPVEPEPTFVDAPPNGSSDTEATAEVETEEPTPAPTRPMRIEDLVPLPPLPEPEQAVAEPGRVLAGLGPVVTADAVGPTLDAARSAAIQEDDRNALGLYRRLADSPAAAEALVEEVLLLGRRGRLDRAILLAEQAPADARSDALHALHARLLLRSDDAEAALGVLAAISIKGPQAREATWLTAVARHRAGDPEAAADLLRYLATGSDRWAERAREWLRRG